MSSRELDAERRKRSLEELERSAWGQPAQDSHLMTTCHRLRKKPIGEFSVEDLRIMVGQNIGLLFLVPMALDVLERDPLAEGDFFPGDLLSSLLRADPGYWSRHEDQRHRLDRVIAGLMHVPAEVEADLAGSQRAKT